MEQTEKDESLHAEVAANLMLLLSLTNVGDRSRDGDITGVAEDIAASLGVPNEWPLVHDTILATLVKQRRDLLDAGSSRS